MNLLTVTVRTWRPSDIPHVVQLVRSILQQEFFKDQSAYPAADLERIPEMYSAPDSTFLVAEEEDRIVGTCGVKAESPQTAILRRFFVVPACRGRGVGAALLRQALEFCRMRGFRDVVIRTSTRMETAIRLCRAHGFKEEGRWMLGEVTLVLFRLKLVS